MKQINDLYKDEINTNINNFVRCIKINLENGKSFCYTEHDEKITFLNDVYETFAAPLLSTLEHNSGLSVNNMEFSAPLLIDNFDEDLIKSGQVENGTIEIYLVHKENSNIYIFLNKGKISKIEYDNLRYNVEFSGIEWELNKKTGRIYARNCDAILGDARCKVNINNSEFKATGKIISFDSPTDLYVSIEQSFENGWFDNGYILLDKNISSNRLIISSFRKIAENEYRLKLLDHIDIYMHKDDLFTIYVSCSKNANECQNKFNNIINFRGFNLLPNDDFITKLPSSDEANDGSSLQR